MGSLKRLAEGHNQQPGAQTGSSSGASSGSVHVIEIGSGESGPHRPKENAPSGGALANVGGLQQIASSGSGGAETKGAIHESSGPGPVIPLDNAWENKGWVAHLLDVIPFPRMLSESQISYQYVVLLEGSFCSRIDDF